MRKLKKVLNSYSQLAPKKVQIEQKRRRISENQMERKWIWPILRYCPVIRMEVLTKPAKNWGQNSLDSNQAHPENSSGALPLQPTCLNRGYEK
jgi:hypothetical protein